MRSFIVCLSILCGVAQAGCIEEIAERHAGQLLRKLAPGQTIRFVFRDWQGDQTVHVSTLTPFPGQEPGQPRHLALAVGNTVGIATATGHIVGKSQIEASFLEGLEISGLSFSELEPGMRRDARYILTAGIGRIVVAHLAVDQGITHVVPLSPHRNSVASINATHLIYEGKEAVVLTVLDGNRITFYPVNRTGLDRWGNIDVPGAESTPLTSIAFTQMQLVDSPTEQLLFVSFGNTVVAFAFTRDLSSVRGLSGWQVLPNEINAALSEHSEPVQIHSITALPRTPIVLKSHPAEANEVPLMLATSFGILQLSFHLKTEEFVLRNRDIRLGLDPAAVPISVGVQRSGLPLIVPHPDAEDDSEE